MLTGQRVLDPIKLYAVLGPNLIGLPTRPELPPLTFTTHYQKLLTKISQVSLFNFFEITFRKIGSNPSKSDWKKRVNDPNSNDAFYN